MERVERYLKRVGRALPRAGRDDVVAELREALLSRIDERARRRDARSPTTRRTASCASWATRWRSRAATRIRQD